MAAQPRRCPKATSSLLSVFKLAGRLKATCLSAAITGEHNSAAFLDPERTARHKGGADGWSQSAQARHADEPVARSEAAPPLDDGSPPSAIASAGGRAGSPRPR